MAPKFETEAPGSEHSVDLDEEERRHLSQLEVLKRVPDFEQVMRTETSPSPSPDGRKRRKRVRAKSPSHSLLSTEERELLLQDLNVFDPSVNYYQAYWRVYFENNGLQEQLLRLSEERNEILEQIVKFKTFYDENDQRFYEERANGRKKHNRRTAQEIERNYICPYPTCEKHYGSEGSLNLHVKIKHGGGNKTDREKMAKTLVMCLAKSTPLPPVDINLPPGVLEQAARDANLTLTPDEFIRLHADASVKFQEYLSSEKGLADMATFQEKYNTQPSFNFAIPYAPRFD